MARRVPKRLPALLVTLVLLVGGLSAGPSAAQAACHPIQTTPVFAGVVPTAHDVLGFDLGDQEVTAAESDAYLGAIDAASDRVTSGTAGFSVEGRPLRYAIVGHARTRDGRRPGRGRKPRSTSSAIRRRPRMTRRRSPPPPRRSCWCRRTSTAVRRAGRRRRSGCSTSSPTGPTACPSTILDNAIVVILPIQNPDGREADTRRNAYDIDMNRDWFARTQPETDAKLELYRQLPPVLDLDVHEMGSYTYFFPPNSDPVYHEIADISNDWINGLYGPAMAAEFDRQHIRYFNYEPYDFFGTFYGDTVPTVAFHAAGMTFEKQSSDPLPVRMYEQYVTSIVSVFAAASNKDAILEDWHASWVEAARGGEQGTLEPNEIFQKGHRLIEQAPTGAVVRHYFLRDDPSKAYEVQRLIRRLQRMDVELYRLTEPLTVPDFRAYGRAPRRARSSRPGPTGSRWRRLGSTGCSRC